MFDFLFPNHPFGGHTLRLVAQAQQGGADVFDIARAMKNVEAGDKDSWERAWLARKSPWTCSTSSSAVPLFQGDTRWRCRRRMTGGRRGAPRSP